MTGQRAAVCAKETCDQPVCSVKWSLCKRHYRRMREARLREGTWISARGKSIEQKVALYTPSGLPASACWEWTGATSGGYATVFVSSTRQDLRVSRILLALGPDDPRVARHHCDNPPCVNPAHLAVGSVGDNNRDTARRDRHMRGERSRHAKLTDQQVMALRRDPRPASVVASELGMYPTSIVNARSGVTWKHLPLVPGVHRSGQHKLTAEARAVISASSLPTRILVDRYGVRRQTIQAVRRAARRGTA